jgi:hypothetical protein
MAAAAVGALISGIAVYAIGARAAQNNPFAEVPALVQTTDGRFIHVPGAQTVGFAQSGYAPMGYVTASQPAAAPVLVQQAPARRTVYRTAQPAQERVVYTETAARPQRSWAKTAMIVGGSAPRAPASAA